MFWIVLFLVISIGALVMIIVERDAPSAAIIILSIVIIALSLLFFREYKVKKGLSIPDSSKYISACAANDFAKAFEIAQKCGREAEDYVFNAEAMYLCAKGDPQSLDRIIYLLTSSYPVVMGDNKDEVIESYETRCDALVSHAIANRNYELARRVIPFYLPHPENSKSCTKKDIAKSRLVEAIKAGVFPDVGEKEIRELKGL